MVSWIVMLRDSGDSPTFRGNMSLPSSASNVLVRVLLGLLVVPGDKCDMFDRNVGLSPNAMALQLKKTVLFVNK
jgi:hypothetical protein